MLLDNNENLRESFVFYAIIAKKSLFSTLPSDLIFMYLVRYSRESQLKRSNERFQRKHCLCYFPYYSRKKRNISPPRNGIHWPLDIRHHLNYINVQPTMFAFGRRLTLKSIIFSKGKKITIKYSSLYGS